MIVTDRLHSEIRNLREKIKYTCPSPDLFKELGLFQGLDVYPSCELDTGKLRMMVERELLVKRIIPPRSPCHAEVEHAAFDIRDFDEEEEDNAFHGEYSIRLGDETLVFGDFEGLFSRKIDDEFLEIDELGIWIDRKDAIKVREACGQ